jgi:hypothetical protein
MPHRIAASGQGLSGWPAAIIPASVRVRPRNHPDKPRPTATGLHKQRGKCSVRPKEVGLSK